MLYALRDGDGQKNIADMFDFEITSPTSPRRAERALGFVN
jgi:hypothetical protein